MTATLGCMRFLVSRGLVLCWVVLLLGVTQELTAAPFYPEGTAPSADVKTYQKVTYDETQPGAYDPAVKAGFAAYQAGDFKKAFAIWLPLAEAGNAEAQYRIGRSYHLGEGVERNLNLALSWYLRAVRRHHAPAMFGAGRIYDQADFEHTDKSAARLLFKGAALRGHRKSQIFYGFYLFNGYGGKKDIIEGLAWIKISPPEYAFIREFLDDIRPFISVDVWPQIEEKIKEWHSRHSFD